MRALRSLAPADAQGGGLQRQRLWRSAAGWLCEQGALPWRSVRFDVVSVYLNPPSASWSGWSTPPMRSSRRRARGRQVPPAGGDEGELPRRYSARLEGAVARLAPWAPPWLVEEGCGHAWEQLVRYQPDRTGLFPWLRVVAYHELLRLNGKKVNERSLELELALEGSERERLGVLERLPALADPHDTETALEAREALRAVARLRWRRRRVIRL